MSASEPGETDLFRMVKGMSFLWKKKNKPGVAHLCYMKDEVWLKSDDGTQTPLAHIDSLGPVSTFPKRHAGTQMLRGWRRHM